MDTIRKAAAGKAAGSLPYVLSDGTPDRYGDVVEPDGWQLDAFRGNPIALFNHQPSLPIGRWHDIRVVGGQLLGELELAKQGTSRRIDEIVSLVEQDILRATSVGFRPLEREPLDPKKPGAGSRFLRQELLEASIVSVPANPAALAKVAKSLGISDDTIRFLGEQAAIGKQAATSGGHAVTKPALRGSPMTISQQIQDTQTRLNAARDALTEYLGAEAQDPVQRDAMSSDVLAIEAELKSLENAERALAPRQQAAATTVAAPAVNRQPLGLKAAPDDDKGRPLWRAIGAQLQAYSQRRSVEDVLNQRWPGDEAAGVILRAAQAGASTTLATWAAELVQTATTAMLEPRDAARILPALAARGTSLQFGPDAGIIRIPSEAATPNIAGSFVGEAQPIPVRRMGFSAITLSPHKVGVITRYSREIAMYSSPSLEGLVRSAIIRKTGAMLDSLLIDAVAGTTTRPAGLANGVSALTATAGGGYAAIIGDLTKLTAPFYAANAGDNLVMLINPAQGLQLTMSPGPGNTGFNWSQQFTNRLTVVESTVVPSGNVYMIEASDFVSVMGTPEFEVSEEATLHIEDTAPTHINPGTPASPVESMFQTNQLALRLILTTTWAMRRTGMVQYLTGANWA